MIQYLPRFRFLTAAILSMVASAATAKDHDISKEKLQAQLSSVSFVENKGQVTDQHQKRRTDIDFKIGTQDINIFIGDGTVHYQWNKSSIKEVAGRKNTWTDAYRMDVVLLGANQHAEVVAEQKQDFFESYYSSQYTGTAASYNRVVYKNIYPGIDWVLYTQNDQLKYDFIVHPGGNAKDIKLQYKGATALNMKDGALTASTPYGSITEHKPYSYDAVTKNEIASSFALSENTLSFNIAAGTGTNDIIIDPLLDWATYYGGTSYDAGIDVAADGSGNVYMCGSTISTSNIATTGSNQTSFGGFEDAFLAKFNITGTRQWATYYGGLEYDNFTDIDLDGSGNIYVAGETGSSSGIATTGAHQTAFGAGFNYDLYLVKFNSSGVRQWATYYGGSGHDIWPGVACDASGNIYLSGETSSTSNISSSGAFQTAIAGSQDGFLAKFNSSGVRQWGTYYGGSSTDRFYSVATDVSGNVYAAGETQSTSGIATSGTHQGAHGTGTWDAFIVKFTGSGGVTWGTYYGGSGSDRITSLACDGSGNVYVGGGTSSSNAIATTGSYQASINNGANTTNTDGFIAKLNASGVRQWGTYYGGSSDDKIFDVALDNANSKVYAVGHTLSTGNISTTGSYQILLNGTSDLFVTTLDFNGVREYGTYLGGTGTEYDGGCGLAVNGGKLYTAGGTYSTAGVAVGTAHQASLSGNADGFLSSFIISSSVYINQPFNDTLFCSGTAFTLPYTVEGSFYPGNVFTAQLSDASGSFASPTAIGTVTAQFSGTIAATIPAGMSTGGGYRIRIASSSPFGYSGNNGKNIGIGLGPVIKPDANYNSPLCAGSTLNLTASTSTAGVFYSWTGPNGYTSNAQNPSRTNSDVTMSGDYIVTTSLYACPSQKDTITVVVKPMPVAPVAGSNSPVCETTTLSLTSSTTTSGVTYSWTGPNSYSSSNQNPNITGSTTAMSGTYTVTANLNGCTQSANTAVTVKPLPAAPTAGSNTPVCEANSINLTSASATSGVSYSWTGPNSYTSTSQNPAIANSTTAMSGTYIVSATLNGCSQTTNTTVLIKPIPANLTIGSNSPICENTTINLSASSTSTGVGYSWTGPNSFSSASQSPAISGATVAMSGTYTLTADLNGCSKTATTSVTVNPLPANVTVIAAPQTLCAGGTINFSASTTSTGTTYEWTGPNSFTSTSATPSIFNATTAATGTYTGKVILSGCSVSGTVSVSVNAKPAKPTLGSNSPICENSTLTLTSTSAGSGITYSWTGPNGFTSSSQNTSITGATTAASGTYTLEAKNGNNCIETESITVVVNPTPALPTAGSNAPICAGSDINLTASSTTTGVTYSWTGPNSFSSALQNPDIIGAGTSAGGNYTVTTTLGTCSRSRTISVAVNPVPVITSITSNTPVCVNNTINLSAQSSVSGVTYTWSGPGGFLSSLQNPVITNATTANGGVYSVTATRLGCSSVPVSTTVFVGILTPTPVAANNGPVCVGSNLQLTATGITNATYSWTGPNSFTSIVQNPFITGVTSAEAGTYTVTATVNGCVSLPGSTLVAINPTSFVNIYPSPNDTICDGNVTLVSVTINPGPTPAYQWFKNGALIPGASAKNYTATGVSTGDEFLCVMSNTFSCGPSHADSSTVVHMTVLPPMIPSVSIVADQTTLFSEWQTVTFKATAVDAGDKPKYQWKRNGRDIIGATSDTWSSSGLANNDSISVVLASDYLCSEPDTAVSNKIGITVTTGVNDLKPAHSLALYPNPNNGHFILKGQSEPGQVLNLEVQNAIGQTIYKKLIVAQANEMNESVMLDDIANGVYLMRIHTNRGDTSLRFTVNK